MKQELQAWYDLWLQEHADTNLIYVPKNSLGEPYLQQVHFVRDRLAYLVWRDVPYQNLPNGVEREDVKALVQVVGEHRSKSVRLPVYQLCRPDLGIRFVLRDNYHDWNVSVISERAIPEERGFEFNSDYLFFQGFPDADQFQGYGHVSHRKFSFSTTGEHDLYAQIGLIMRNVRP